MVSYNTHTQPGTLIHARPHTHTRTHESHSRVALTRTPYALTRAHHTHEHLRAHRTHDNGEANGGRANLATIDDFKVEGKVPVVMERFTIERIVGEVFFNKVVETGSRSQYES